MSKQTINIGASPNDGTGTPLRTSFDYTNQNFTELYTAVGPSGNNIVVPGTATITGDLNVSGNGAFIGIGMVGLQRPFIPTGQNGTTTLDYRWYSTGTTYVTGARIRASSEAAWSSVSAPTRLMFETVPSGAVGLSERYRISGDGLHTWSNVNNVGGTQMTLDGTGLIVTGATITGDLTVRTNKLAVTSTGVGIGTASPDYAADVSVATVDGLRVKNTLATGAYFNRFHISNDTGINFIGYCSSYSGGTVLGLGVGSNSIFSDAAAPFGIVTTVNQPLVFGINGTTAMTLNSTGLGIGASPSSGGSISNASYVLGGIFSTLNGILSSVATATPTTIFAAPSDSILMVTASVNGAAPSDYKVVAVVKRGGAAVAITTISSATSVTITSSGTDIQATQTSGGNQNIYFNVLRLA